MPDQVWTVKELIEARQSFRQMQGSITRWGLTAWGRLEEQNT